MEQNSIGVSVCCKYEVRPYCPLKIFTRITVECHEILRSAMFLIYCYERVNVSCATPYVLVCHMADKQAIVEQLYWSRETWFVMQRNVW